MRSWKKSLGISLPLVLLATGACGPASGDAPKPPPPAAAGCDDSAKSRFVANQLTLPSITRSYAGDMDGDGSTDNRFHTLFSGLQAVGFDSQTLVNNMATNGRGMTLVEMSGSGQREGCSATMRMQAAEHPAAPPRYDGKDTFTPRSGSPAVSLSGSVSDGVLGTTSPTQLQASEVTPLRISVTLVEGVSVPLDLYGVQLQGAVSDSGTMEGEVHAVLRKQDIDEQVIPAMAQALTAKVNKEPDGALAQTIVSFFEDQDSTTSKAKCDSEPARCCARNPATCDLSAEELRENSTLMQFLEPDVQMFQNGSWKPTPGGTAKDSLSIGFGLSAVQASF